MAAFMFLWKPFRLLVIYCNNWNPVKKAKKRPTFHAPLKYLTACNRHGCMKKSLPPMQKQHDGIQAVAVATSQKHHPYDLNSCETVGGDISHVTKLPLPNTESSLGYVQHSLDCSLPCHEPIPCPLHRTQALKNLSSMPSEPWPKGWVEQGSEKKPPGDS